MTDTEIKQERVEKLAEHMARQVYNLAVDYLPKIEKAGSESDKGEAKVSFNLAWPAYHHSPSVVAKMSFSSSTKDETESQVDLEQTTMDLDSEESKKPEPKQLTHGEVINVENFTKEDDANAWTDACERLADDGVLLEIEDQDGECFKGVFAHDEDYGMTVFECDEGGVILVENIAKWRNLSSEENDTEAQLPTTEGEVYTRFASDNKGRDESGQVTASATESERSAALAVVLKLHPDSQREDVVLKPSDESREFRKGTAWNVWNYEILVSAES